MTGFKGDKSWAGAAARLNRARTPWKIMATMVAALAASTHASAITVVDTYTGTVMTNAQIANYYPGNTDNDVTGLFGTASPTGADIEGQPFKAAVTTNIALAPDTTVDGTSGDVDSAYATSVNSSAFSTVDLTINGASFIFSENFGSPSQPTNVSEGGAYQEAVVIYSSSSCCAGYQLDEQVTADPSAPFQFPYSLITPGTYAVQDAGESITDEFLIDSGGAFPFLYSRGFLDTTNLTVAVMGVPDAPTWTLMIVGFGALGVVLRRSRRERAIAPS